MVHVLNAEEKFTCPEHMLYENDVVVLARAHVAFVKERKAFSLNMGKSDCFQEYHLLP